MNYFQKSFEDYYGTTQTIQEATNKSPNKNPSLPENRCRLRG